MDLRKRFVVRGKNFKLVDCDPNDTAGFRDEPDIEEQILKNKAKLDKLQQKLYAEHDRALLIVLQAMDAGGKDGTIKHVMSGVNPQGCSVTSFKQPSEEEKAHDYLWRVHKATPRFGNIGIFNRSHYEDVLIVRVHKLAPKDKWEEHYPQIRHFEKHLADNGTSIVKFFLNISKDEQEKRFQERLKDPSKNWKASAADFEERKYWDDYMAAYQDALFRCSRKFAPWYVIPANHKWFRNFAISQILVDTLEDLHLQYPAPAGNIPKDAGKKKA
jgi:PPK2 family polyphosphate:nucleotide phosphotransferase